MALGECARVFLAENPGVEDVFYATTPPGVLTATLDGESVHIGNLCLSRKPDVFIGPRELLRNLAKSGRVTEPSTFAQSRGHVLLVRKGNPSGITGVSDLLRPEITLFISNPNTESTSYRVYADSLIAIAKATGADSDALVARLEGAAGKVMHGECIHHREAPQAIADGSADAAIVYYHLGLRYTRIFPDDLECVPLGGTTENPQPLAGTVLTSYGVAMVASGGRWGGAFAAFMRSPRAAEIYARHGLQPVQESTSH